MLDTQPFIDAVREETGEEVRTFSKARMKTLIRAARTRSAPEAR